MDINTLTVIHTALSFIALGAGIVAVCKLFQSSMPDIWTMVFLWMAVATSVTGFFFPFNGVTPAIVVGVIALGVLAAVFVALYGFRFAGAWRWVYAAGIVISQYLLVFVTVAQAFNKIGFLRALAPTGTELPFAVAELFVFAGFGLLGFKAIKHFYPVIH